MVGSGDYNIFSVAVFNSWFIIEAVEIWKIRKNTVFCSDRIICFRKHRFWIYCISISSIRSAIGSPQDWKVVAEKGTPPADCGHTPKVWST